MPLVVNFPFLCLHFPVEPSEIAQLIVLSTHIKTLYGGRLFQALFVLSKPVEAKNIRDYLAVCQLLVDLHEFPGIYKLVRETMPNLPLLLEKLEEVHAEYLTQKYPERDINETIARFAQQDELVQFPLSLEELEHLKSDYIAVKEQGKLLNTLPLIALKEKAKLCGTLWREKHDPEAKHELIAIVAETIRRFYKISPYDTQILSILALINTPEQLKGRIAQIKTGEGKSTIIAMLAALMGCQGDFVDIVTSSPDLAIRDAEKYAPFFEALGLSVSHICDHHAKEEDFSGQILYGTNTDFEFAMLRDGLNNSRQSMRDGVLQNRTFDVVIVDEVDNLFLDTALNSALLSIPGKEDISWVYAPILNYIKSIKDKKIPMSEMVNELRAQLLMQLGDKHAKKIEELDNFRLKKWLISARQALYQKVEERDYMVKNIPDASTGGMADRDEIVIVDYINTGRLNEGCQWKDGLHQMLQAKHGLKITPESLTTASLSHPTYFNLYQHIMGVTGTMGEPVERDEIQKIYGVSSLDTPPHFNSLREQLPTLIFNKNNQKLNQILLNIQEMQQQKRPSLVLFKTIRESEIFSKMLRDQGIKHQLINENQREAEEYLISRAGEEGMITIATNTAGRGTDILLSPASKEAGGLYQAFGFYPNNLRIQGQGFGRAGRQGQPGSCCMILSLEDEYIQQLLSSLSQTVVSKLFNSPDIEELNDLMKLKELLNSDFLSAEQIMPLLDKLRTKNIQQESKRRFQCSQKEILFFEKLREFFEKIGVAYQLSEDEGFKEAFLKVCETGESDSREAKNLMDEEENWTQVLEMAKLLIANQCDGKTVDWSGFLNQFKRTYLANARREWAQFYTRLHDEINDGDIHDIKIQMEQIYAEAQSQLDSYLSNPQENMLNYLNSILHTAYQEIFPDEESVQLSKLTEAIESGHIGLFMKTIEGRKINSDSLYSALQLAIVSGRREMVNVLIHHGAALDEHLVGLALANDQPLIGIDLFIQGAVATHEQQYRLITKTNHDMKDLLAASIEDDNEVISQRAIELAEMHRKYNLFHRLINRQLELIKSEVDAQLPPSDDNPCDFETAILSGSFSCIEHMLDSKGQDAYTLLNAELCQRAGDRSPPLIQYLGLRILKDRYEAQDGLHIAATYGIYEVISDAYRAGLDFELSPNQLPTALDCAIKANQATTAIFLYLFGANTTEKQLDHLTEMFEDLSDVLCLLDEYRESAILERVKQLIKPPKSTAKEPLPSIGTSNLSVFATNAKTIESDLKNEYSALLSN